MIKEKIKKSLEIKRTFNIRKYLIILISIVLIFILFLVGSYLFKGLIKIPTCGDGTFYDECSLRKGYFCLEGILIEKASVCDCPEILIKQGDLCISKYQNDSKNITLKYILRGEEGEIDLVVYRGMADYLSSLSRFIFYDTEEKPTKADFKLRNINEKEQRELLLPLVVEIQNIAESGEDQVRIAVSIVQNILYNESEKKIIIGDTQINYPPYPYEVLYDVQGLCDGKSKLLAFLLKEMGYGVVLFYYPLENHDAVGIKCPLKYSLNNSGYCFIETTGVSIVTDDQEYYMGWGKLSSKPEITFICEGNSLSDDLYEYKDAKNLIKINEIIEKTGEINWIKHFKLEKLKKKYGLFFSAKL